MFTQFTQYWYIAAIVIGLIVMALSFRLVLRLFGVVMIPQDSIGIVDKKFVLFGSHKTLPDGTLIALNGEAGVQADTLAPGLHFLYWPWQYAVQIQKFITIQQGKVGVVEARDGKPLKDGRVLAKQVDSDSFQDARKFLLNGGNRGPQINIITPGTYRINTGLFRVLEAEALEIGDNEVGIVTTKDGKPLETGEIAGKEVSGQT